MKNTRLKHGLPKTSKYWQDWKNNNSNLNSILREIAVGMILGDASLSKVGKEASIKFEQGYKQKEFIEDLFLKYKDYIFMEELGIRYLKDKITVKSYWFRTYSHKTFTELWDLFYDENSNKRSKIIKPNLILNELGPIGLAYWIMCDGSLQNDYKSLILHTQGFDKEMNLTLSEELNQKFNLHSRVILHKQKYWVIFIPSQDHLVLNNLIKDYMIESMMYKLPKGN